MYALYGHLNFQAVAAELVELKYNALRVNTL